MKTESALFRSFGVLVALLVFLALPSSTALANCGQCADVEIEWYYDPGTAMHFELSVANPSGANIYFTTSLDNTEPDNPSWDSSGNPTGTTLVCYNCTGGQDVPIPYMHTLNIKARAWKYCYYQSVNISSDSQHNPNE
jgi:hypothetical protein